MTSLLHKKHRITALKPRAAIRIDHALYGAAFLLCFGLGSQAMGQAWTSPGESTLRPVAPRFDASIGSDQKKRTPTSSGTPLRWRASNRVRSGQSVTPSPARPSVNKSDSRYPVAQAGYNHSGSSTGSIIRVVYQQAEPSQDAAPDPLGANGQDLFGNPDNLAPTTPQPPAASELFGQEGALTSPDTTGAGGLPAVPAETGGIVMPDLQPVQPSDTPDGPAAGVGTQSVPEPVVQQPPGFATEDEPLVPPSSEQTEDPGEAQLDLLGNPFHNNRNSTPSLSDRDGADPAELPDSEFYLKSPKRGTDVSCEALRKQVADRTIDRISLDISPAFRPDVLDDEEYDKIREQFNRDQQSRQWRDIEGSLIGEGKLVGLSYQNVLIEGDDGKERSIKVSRLSEPDWAFLSNAWGLPRVCRISQVAYQPRNWTPTKMTWSASGLCHNPLYFEEVQLERYGHTTGPLSQPVVSTAHFFANIAVLPYKMGIHPCSECQYALGYYRPGNCAPYLLPPIPLSLRGAVSQGATIVGGFWLIP